MGKFIDLLVPDYIYKAENDESKVVKLLIACIGVFGMMMMFLKFVNLMTGGQEVQKWQLWIPIVIFAVLGSMLVYAALLVFSHMIVRYIVYTISKFVIPQICHFYLKRVKKNVVTKAACAETLEQQETVESTEETSLQLPDLEENRKEVPAFRTLLKSESPEKIMSAINEMTRVDDDKMYLLTIILLLIQHDKVSFKSMNVKDIYRSLIQDFGEFMSCSHFQSQWKRLKDHDFAPETLENYESNRKVFYNNRDKDYDKYCKAGKKLKENGFI